MQASSADFDKKPVQNLAADQKSAPHFGVCIAFSTLGEGITRIRLPEPQPGITYLILLQCPELVDPGIIAQLQVRNDTRVLPLAGTGLSNSRNAALDNADAPLLLFADDDVGLDLEGILALAALFSQDLDLTLAAGWRRERLSRATGFQTGLTRYNSGRICAPEFMVRLEHINGSELRFDPEFGLGARYGVGEDYIFITDILAAGLKGISVALATGSHPHESTGDHWSDPDLMRARQAMLSRVFGAWAPLLRVAYGWKQRAHFGSWQRLWAFIWNKSD